MTATSNPINTDLLRVGLAQIAPVWLNRDQTIAKIVTKISEAGQQGCQLVAFGEALLPGYPFWLERTNGAQFNSPIQKALFAHYLDQAVQLEAGHLDPICAAAAKHGVAVVLGTVEKAADRGGHSLYCSLIYVNQQGHISNIHRKLMPTYEERLVWSPGDGHGLRVHPLGAFQISALNCWENWMPLPRASLYAMGANLHVAIWPGGAHNTSDITRFIAQEGRLFVLSVSGLMRREDVPAHLPHRDTILRDFPDVAANGGSCLAAPNGRWVIEPAVGKEALLVATISHQTVREERQNFDPVGHYSRPDVTQLTLNRQRQSTLIIKE